MKSTNEYAVFMYDYAGREDEARFGDKNEEWWEDSMTRASYVADFETTTELDDCRVWAFGVSKIGDEYTFEWGHTVEEFIEWCEQHAQSNVYFHHLEFDGAFIMDWLERNGWTWVETRQDATEMSYTTVISDSNQVYCIELFFTELFRVKIYNSLKIIPLSVENIAKSYDLPIRKGSIDYELPRPAGYEPTQEELAYVQNDTEIVARALKIFLDQGLNKMTAGSNALSNFRKGIGNKYKFRRIYPLLDKEQDTFLRRAYRGGFTYVSPDWAGKVVGNGCVYDVNSMYPSVMRNEMMPYGSPTWFQGTPPDIPALPLWVAQVTCAFKLKEGHIPCIQLKGNMRFGQTEYIVDSHGQTTITVTNVDWALMQKQYHVYNVRWEGGYLFKAANFRFRRYIDEWIGVKNQATIDGNAGLRNIAKLMLNSLYGKFATRMEMVCRRPMIINDVLRYVDLPPEEREPVYLPVGIYTTSYARARMVRAAQANYDRFLYADTDSLHLLGSDVPAAIKVDDVELGAWKHESDFYQAKYLRQKCYIEYEVGKDEPTVRVAGMPKAVHDQVTLDNFNLGATYTGKLYTHRVSGGIVLKADTMTLKE